MTTLPRLAQLQSDLGCSHLTTWMRSASRRAPCRPAVITDRYFARAPPMVRLSCGRPQLRQVTGRNSDTYCTPAEDVGASSQSNPNEALQAEIQAFHSQNGQSTPKGKQSLSSLHIQLLDVFKMIQQ